tara:strand:- start:4432 stop:5571 length:1140 start_codon:yes stop_codon:yes gene_type:complete
MNNLEIIIITISCILYLIPTIVASLNLFFFNSNNHNQTNNQKNKVSVLIPARNEEKNIEKCVNSIIEQGEIVEEILVYNDHSTDKTEKIIKSLVKKYKNIVKQTETKNLPEGWLGKNYACHRLAISSKSEYILFVDADTTLKNKAISNLYKICTKSDNSMISAWPKIVMKTKIEKLLMPILNLIVFTIFPYIISTKINLPNLGLAHGACIFFNKKTYLKLGGHKLVKNNFFEDTSLAKKWRTFGEKSKIINGENIITVRMYKSFNEITEGFTKNFYPALGSVIRFFIFQVYFFVAYILFPILILVFVFQSKVDILFFIVIFLSYLPRIIINLKFRYGITSLVVNPLSIIIMLYIGFRSYYHSLIKKNITWKKRIYNFEK